MEEVSQLSNPHPHISKLQDVRPAKLNLTSVAPNFKRWAECKIVGKNITIRSYAGACSFNSEMFVYGGLQILNGILSDFNSINLGQEEGRFQWKQIKIEGDNPGPRAKCAMVCTKQGMMYLIGGIKSTTLISNQIHSFNVESKLWNNVKYSGELPPLESFGFVFLDNHRVIMVCGYDGTLNSETNSVYEFDIAKNQVKTLFKHSDSAGNPEPRSNCGISCDGSNIYMFGGCKGDFRMNDLWKFSLESHSWTQLRPTGEIPSIRSGHIMEYVKGSILMYGGLHEVTWELDDLHLYDIKANEWKILEIDSARKKKEPLEEQKTQKEQHSPHPKEGNSPTKRKDEKYFTDTVTTMKPREVFMDNRKQANNLENPEKEGGHGSMLNQKRKKEFQHKKAEMLKIFEIKEENKEKYLNIEPISQAIKNSLQILGETDKSKQQMNHTHHKIQNFGKASISKFLEPLSNTVNVVYGKKPCARDGHNSVRISQYIVIFGGDRHHMSFNDIFRLDVHNIEKEFI